MMTTLTSNFKLLANGFIGGVVVTASISYSLFNKDKSPKNLASDDLDRFPFGKPVDLRQTFSYSGHTVYHDAARKQPLWVSQVLTKESIIGKANRKYSKFKRDDQVMEGFAAENGDYLKSGWSRGHMAAAADCKYSQEAMDHTFLLTNIVPQDFSNNNGFWNRFEMFCRDLTSSYAKVHVITGPLYKANSKDGSKIYVNYEVIGSNRIPVPTHLFKVIMAYDKPSDKPATAAFIVPNIPIAKEEDELTKYQVSIDELQQLTGFTFHPQLPKEKTVNLCTSEHSPCKLSNWKALEIYFASKNINRATSFKDLDDAVAPLKRYRINLDEKLLAQITKKQLEIESHQRLVQNQNSHKYTQ